MTAENNALVECERDPPEDNDYLARAYQAGQESPSVGYLEEAKRAPLPLTEGQLCGLGHAAEPESAKPSAAVEDWRSYTASQLSAQCPKLCAYLDLRDAELADALAKLSNSLKREEELRALLNTPETDDFFRGVPLEAAHQRHRWPSEQDAGKTPADWFWLVGYLAGKCLASHIAGNRDKALHHAISTAAALANWHRAIKGVGNMRPGIDSPAEATILTEKPDTLPERNEV